MNREFSDPISICPYIKYQFQKKKNKKCSIKVCLLFQVRGEREMDEELVLRYIVFNLRFAIRFTLFLWDCWSIPYGQLYLVTRYTFLLRSLTVMNFFRIVDEHFKRKNR